MTTTNIERVNPAGMHSNPVYSQATILPVGARLMVIGGQNSVDAAGNVVGVGDLRAQTAQALDNLTTVLAAANATLDDLLKVTIYLVDGQDLRPAFGEWMARWGERTNPPSVTGLTVVRLARPDFLIEIEALAAVR